MTDDASDARSVIEVSVADVERRSRAADALSRAPESMCPRCGRVTKTTSDGICADCWASKGGRPMGWKKDAPTLGLFEGLDDLFIFRRF